MGSIWEQNSESIWTSELSNELDTDILVIGAGMAGILTAYFLSRRGAHCTVIDAGPVAGGFTKNTTAKITSQHSIIYSRLIRHGKTKAQQYASANEQAITAYRDLVDSQNIDCDFENVSAYIYATKDKKLVENEYKAARAAGIKGRLTTDIELPFPVRSALEFPNQVQFNPLKFISHLAKNLEIYTHTRALEVTGNDVKTDKAVIHAKKIIIATHFPFINKPGYYFARMHQERSYVVALKGAGHLKNTYIGVDGEGYSFRSYGDNILLGGGNHRTGENTSGGKYQKLIKASKKFFPESQIVMQWSAQDCMTGDGIPYIGRYSSKFKNLYVATGFNKWGMTSSMVSAIILSDMVLGKKPEFSVFSPLRLNYGLTFKSFVMDGGKSIKGLGKSMLQIPHIMESQIPEKSGDIIHYNDMKAALYKDGKGKCHIVNGRCPHMGCQLTWNADENTWDCPCHGSRFDTEGHVISGPAQTDNKIEKHT